MYLLSWLHLLFYVFYIYHQLTLYELEAYTGYRSPVRDLTEAVWAWWVYGFTSLSYLFQLLFPDLACLSLGLQALYGLTSVLALWVLEGAW